MDDDLIELVNNQISGSGSNSAVYSGSNVIVSNNAKMQSELGRQKTRQILGLAQEPQLSAAAIEIARSEASKPPIMVK